MARQKQVYTSNEIARVWVNQSQETARCPSAMRFHGTQFYSYRTVIADIVTHNNGRVYLISADNYSPTTAGHLAHVCSAVHGTRFYVPGASMDATNLADFPRILAAWQEEAIERLEASAQSREPKKTRLILEAYRIALKMREFAEFFHLSLDEYHVTIPVPDKKRTDEETYSRIIALRLGNPSPWMQTAPSPLEAFLSVTATAEPVAA